MRVAVAGRRGDRRGTRSACRTGDPAPRRIRARGFGDRSFPDAEAADAYDNGGVPGASSVRVVKHNASASPYLASLQILDADGRPATTVRPEIHERYRIELRAGDDVGIGEVVLELDTGTGWLPLASSFDGSIHRAWLPALAAGSTSANLRVTLYDEADRATANSMANTIAPAFTIASQTIFMDDFED